jgi:bacteriocin-like protein
MATITISDLSPIGLNLFSDPENYLDELSDNKLTEINGGNPFLLTALTGAALISFASGVSVSVRITQRGR